MELSGYKSGLLRSHLRRFAVVLMAIILAKLLGQFGISSLAAHPHVFIDGLLGPHISPDGEFLEGIDVRWSFDQMYSSQMILDFDKNGNGKIDADENKEVYEQAFEHLKDLHYFLEVAQQKNHSYQTDRGGSSKYLGTAKNFQASIKDGEIIYQFYVPFHGSSSKGLDLSGGKEYVIYLEDGEYFIAFDSLLEPGLRVGGVTLSSKEFMVQNLQWGPYPVRSVSVKGR